MPAIRQLQHRRRAYTRFVGLTMTLVVALVLGVLRSAILPSTLSSSLSSERHTSEGNHFHGRSLLAVDDTTPEPSSSEATSTTATTLATTSTNTVTSSAASTNTTTTLTLTTSTTTALVTTTVVDTTASPDWENVACSGLSHKHDVCHFVRSADSCEPDGGFIDYLEMAYCYMPLGLAVVVLIVWLLVLFVALGSTAEEFFCPALAVISKVLKLSDNVAGVTFLALGNGAPDIFSVFSSVNHVKDGFNLALGELFGAGVFITTVVIGTVAYITPFSVTRRPFIRDASFYLIATTLAFYILMDGKINIAESIGFIGIYALYVVVVILGRHIYQRRKSSLLLEQTRIEARKALQREIISPESPRGIAGLIDVVDAIGVAVVPSKSIQEIVTRHHHLGPENFSFRSENTPLLGRQEETPSPWRQLFSALKPCDTEEFARDGFFAKLYSIIKAPIALVLTLTTPVVDLDEEDEKWRKYLTIIQCLISPAFVTLGVGVAFVQIGGTVPVYAVGLLIGALLAALIAFCTSWESVPRYHFLLSFVGFAASVIWIYVTANEIVNVLQTLGRILGIGDAVLGLTVLAWGNSVGDFVADITVARQGFPQMAVGACFGSPALSMLLGIGISSLAACSTKANPFLLPAQGNHVLVTSGAFQMFSLASSLIIIPLRGFKVDKYYAFYLYVIYAIYVALAVSLEAADK